MLMTARELGGGGGGSAPHPTAEELEHAPHVHGELTTFWGVALVGFVEMHLASGLPVQVVDVGLGETAMYLWAEHDGSFFLSPRGDLHHVQSVPLGRWSVSRAARHLAVRDGAPAGCG